MPQYRVTLPLIGNMRQGCRDPGDWPLTRALLGLLSLRLNGIDSLGAAAHPHPRARWRQSPGCACWPPRAPPVYQREGEPTTTSTRPVPARTATRTLSSGSFPADPDLGRAHMSPLAAAGCKGAHESEGLSSGAASRGWTMARLACRGPGGYVLSVGSAPSCIRARNRVQPGACSRGRTAAMKTSGSAKTGSPLGRRTYGTYP
jgi:hypothetical protein